MNPSTHSPIDVVLVWHMHQPDYRAGPDRAPRLPWVYLHALKDYADMAAHLEAHPRARAVVNFTPVLLDQLDDYARQFSGGELRDPLLRLLARPDGVPFSDDEREFVLGLCFHANHRHMLEPFAAYRRLRDLARIAEAPGAATAYLSDRYLHDLITWFHLAWTGETVRRTAPLVTELMAQGAAFTFAQRLALLELAGGVVSQVIARYRRLEQAGRIELSTTPYQHPLAPLLVDFTSARQARPGLPLPNAAAYPGGGERLEWHLQAARRDYELRFGHPPEGLWPAEGAISDAVAEAAARAGFRWIASGEQVLMHSLRQAGRAPAERAAVLYRPYRLLGARDLLCFFRDDHLSDLIGFAYHSWDGAHAARHFVDQIIAAVAHAPAAPVPPVVSVILDGENPWESYPYNGYYFLEALYGELTAHPRIRMQTYRDWIAQNGQAPIEALAHCVAGSWVFGDLTTWIGSPDKNRAWDLLVEAKRAFDAAIAAGRLDQQRLAAAQRQLGVCEASDWFWWFGDYNPAESVERFDRLWREQLRELYRLLDAPAPASLDVPLSRGAAHVQDSGTMRRSTEKTGSDTVF